MQPSRNMKIPVNGIQDLYRRKFKKLNLMKTGGAGMGFAGGFFVRSSFSRAAALHSALSTAARQQSYYSIIM